MEVGFVEAERHAVAPWTRNVPTRAPAFLAWFERLEQTGPGQGDPLFPWLAQEADVTAMRWFIKQEAAGEAGFDDLVALSQLRLPAGPKLEMARNYWDEMGRGRLDGMHGPMLDRAVAELDVVPDPDETVWESLALANLMLAMAGSRRYVYHAIGALGVVELTAPGRVSRVNEGLQRLGISPTGRRYFQLHAGLDVRHSEAWNREVLGPLVERDPDCAVALAEGALMRMRAGARCFERYRAHLGIAAERAISVREGRKLPVAA
ncbi:hypothetical protein B1810_16125 [Panacagrimonas perspica]|nr:hypothetical protein B1810_16125 [Panacagrimonas perspica]